MLICLLKSKMKLDFMQNLTELVYGAPQDIDVEEVEQKKIEKIFCGIILPSKISSHYEIGQSE